MGKLSGKVAVITGGDSGIGAEVARQFAAEGADVAIIYNYDDQSGEMVVRQIEGEGRKGMRIKVDIGEPAEAKDAIRRIVERFGRIDVLVNDAGLDQLVPFEQITPEQIERTFKTNIFGMFYITQAALPHMPDGSRIINTASIAALRGSAGMAHYAASKGAVAAFTLSLADALAQRKIRVNAVAPGPVDTPMTRSFGPQFFQNAEKVYPLGIAKPTDIAPTYVMLASEGGNYYSGQILSPNGGRIMGI
jgi:NAD(P)-dependent dehydrogenase (short-subunit alcohol dehydrogenase family)